MSLDADELRDDLTECVNDLPVTVKCAGSSFTATSSDWSGSRVIDVDGEMLEVDRQLVCDIDNLPTKAVQDEVVTIAGTDFRILSVSKHQDAVGCELNLKSDLR